LSVNPADETPKSIGLSQVLIVFGGISMTLTLLSAMRASYHGQLFTESLSFFINDGWCDYKTQGVGIHCFGDFGTWRSVELSPDAFLGVLATGHPLVLLLGLPYQVIPYSLGAVLNSFLLFAATIAPLVITTRSLLLVERVAIIVFFGVWNIGTIATLDRGNHIGFVGLLIFLYLDALQKQKWGSATFWLALIACFKWWGILFVVPLLALRMWRYAVRSGILAIGITYASLGFFPGPLLFKVERIFETVTSREIGASVSTFSISANTLWIRLGCLLQKQPACDPSAEWANGFTATVIKLLLVAVTVGILWFLIQSRRQVSGIGVALFPVIGIAPLPEAQLYNASLLTVTIALLLQLDSSSSEVALTQHEKRSYQKTILVLSLLSASAVTPIAFRVTSALPFSIYNGLTYEFRIQYLTIPSLAIAMLIVAGLWSLQVRRCNTTYVTKRSAYPNS